MPRAKNTKTHNIFLIDKNKLFNAIEADHPTFDMRNVSTEAAIISLMEADDRYQIQTLKENVDMQGFSVKLFSAERIIIKANSPHFAEHL